MDAKEFLEKYALSSLPSQLIYCDYIAEIIRKCLRSRDNAKLIREISRVKIDLGPDGSLLTTNKFIYLTDINGTKYTITVEQS